MRKAMDLFGVVGGALILATLGASTGFAQSSGDMQALRKDIESLKQGQKAMQKDIGIIRDILSGKQPPLDNVSISIGGSPFQGPKDAKFVIVEFSDFQCPFCGRYATQTYSQVIDDYVKTGKVKYVFRDFPLEQLHPNAAKAAEASHCAEDQGKFWDLHDRMFKNQSALDAKEMLGHATVLALDVPKFQQCLESGKYTAKVKKDQEDGAKVNVKGTPTFFFGTVDPKDPTKIKAVSMFSGAQPYQQFKDAFDKLMSPPKDEGKDKDGGSQ